MKWYILVKKVTAECCLCANASATTFVIMTLNRTTMNIMSLIVTLGIMGLTATQQNDYAECHNINFYAERR
jgi:hypothetical protein